jgi:3D (Asp-Asp-Asp) domain-containing protein
VLATRSHEALLGLYALDSRLADARAQLGQLRGRVEALRREQRLAVREAAIVRANLRASQRLLADRLRELYEEGEPDAIAVVLGAGSLNDALARLEELEQSANLGARAAAETRAGRERLARLAATLAAHVQRAQVLEAQAERSAARLRAARNERVGFIAALERQRRLTRGQITTLETRARDVVRRTHAVEQQAVEQQAVAAETPVAEPTAPPGVLTVTATGYSLSGRTSTGLPVGPGVVAVDPAVIPLGTRITIPGYGEGVAADTGSAVRGSTIDLWFPSTADALAWGKRTVTITLH